MGQLGELFRSLVFSDRFGSFQNARTQLFGDAFSFGALSSSSRSHSLSV